MKGEPVYVRLSKAELSMIEDAKRKLLDEGRWSVNRSDVIRELLVEGYNCRTEGRCDTSAIV